MKYLSGFVAALILAVVACSAFIAAGGYNIAASDEHAGLTHWLLDKTKQRSVAVRAETNRVPETFNATQVKGGFTEYNEMCVTCHGAPGKEPSDIGKGLNPHPPDLGKAVTKWSNAELFWILKNGIKMTGMPAFGATHSDETLWSIVAFLRELPRTSAANYQAMEQSGSQQGHDSGEHSHQHSH
jgi:mono/diheme cytochrome c family protein